MSSERLLITRVHTDLVAKACQCVYHVICAVGLLRDVANSSQYCGYYIPHISSIPWRE